MKYFRQLLALSLLCCGVSLSEAHAASVICASKSNGALRVAKKCSSSEIKVSTLSMLKGPTGSAGPKGATGAAGAKGVTGAKGATGAQGPSRLVGLVKLDKDGKVLSSSPGIWVWKIEGARQFAGIYAVNFWGTFPGMEPGDAQANLDRVVVLATAETTGWAVANSFVAGANADLISVRAETFPSMSPPAADLAGVQIAVFLAD